MQHVVLDCPAYMQLRNNSDLVQAFSDREPALFSPHRALWNRRELRCLLRFYLDLLECRENLMGRHGRRGAQSARMEVESA